MSVQLFQKSLMASEDVKSYIGTGVFYNGSNPAAIHDGAVVSVGGLEDSDAYTGIKDINARKLTAPTAVTSRVAFVDYVGVSHGEIQGVNYRVGDKTAGLSAIAGERVRYRTPQIDDTFWLGSGNFVSAPAIGKFAVLTANGTTLTPAASAPASGLYVSIETSKNLVEGTVNTDTLYFCRVMAC